jgi:hypothetical protein
VELLEIPQLVEACARNGFHDEALELALFANSLERKHLLAIEFKNPEEEIPSSSNTATTSGRRGTGKHALQGIGGGGGGGGKSIVQNLVNDVHKTLSELRGQLLQKLSEEAALPKLLTILSSLRKLDGILVDRKISLEHHSSHASHSSTSSPSSSHVIHENQDKLSAILSQSIETSLQMSYLEARSLWIERMISTVYQNSYHSELQNKLFLNSIEINSELNPSAAVVGAPGSPVKGPQLSPSSTHHLGSYGKGIEILEIYRSSWYSVITQFNALFMNHSSSPSSSSSFTPTTCSSITLLSHWIQNQIQLFQDDLETVLQEIDEIISFKLYFEQVLLFSLRMSEIGCNFKEFVIPIFDSHLKQRIVKVWAQGTNQFKQMILTEKYIVPSEETEAGNPPDSEPQVSLSVCLDLTLSSPPDHPAVHATRLKLQLLWWIW